MNAVVASGVDAADWAGGFDSAWLDFTKGLGAPVGACLAGLGGVIEEAWRWKQMLGGAMRQSGIVAAAGLYALDHHVERLADDHARARRAGRGARRAAGRRRSTRRRSRPTSSIFDVPDAPASPRRSRSATCAMSHFSPTRVRAVTHSTSTAGIERALAAAAEALAVRSRDGHRHRDVPALRGDLRARDHGRPTATVTAHPRRRRRRLQPRLHLPEGRRAAGAARGPRPPAHAAACATPGGDLRPVDVGRGVRGDRPPPAADPATSTAATRSPCTSATRARTTSSALVYGRVLLKALGTRNIYSARAPSTRCPSSVRRR